jgi:GNAT superfamily N-acetyltransferase
LAEYERSLSAVQVTEALLLSTLSFPITASSDFHPGHARCFLIFPSPSDREAALGMAFYHLSYSTWTGPGIWLEDQYVMPEHRSKSYGKALLAALAREVDKVNPTGNGRLEWEALKWNKLGVDFYVADGVRAEVNEEYIGFRLAGDGLKRLAAS